MSEESTNGAIPDCQSQLLDLFDLLVDVIFCIKAADGTYVAVNQAFVRRTGRSSKREVVGRRASDFFSMALAERYEEQDAQVLSTGRPLRDELELIRREDGSLGWYLTAKFALTPDEEGVRAGLVNISRDLRTPREDDLDARALAKIVDHVQDNLQHKIRVADLAAVAGLSGSQLDRRMRRTFGLSTSKYIIRARVDRAAELLSDPAIPLADVATQAGFYDQANLTHQFGRLTNETPGQFRANQVRRNAI